MILHVVQECCVLRLITCLLSYLVSVADGCVLLLMTDRRRDVVRRRYSTHCHTRRRRHPRRHSNDSSCSLPFQATTADERGGGKPAGDARYAAPRADLHALLGVAE